MKINNMQAVIFYNSVKELSRKRLPTDILFALKYNFNVITPQVQTYEELRKSVISEDGKITPEMEKLLMEEVEHNVKKIKKEDLKVVDNLSAGYDKLTLSDIDSISFMIEEG